MPQRANIVVTTSWDDGHPLDVKLAEVLSDYGIAGTFYAAPRNRERSAMGPGQLRQLAERFEIGAHSLTHPDLRRLSDADLARELSDGQGALADVLGRPVEMFCYPKGRYNARVRGAVIDCGFIGARTTRSFVLGLPRDPWLMPTAMPVRDCRWWVWVPHCLRSVSLRGFGVLARRGIGKSWSAMACELFEDVVRHGGVWHLWGHSWEIEEHDLWDDLREVLERVSGRDDALYLTNGEVVRMAQATPRS